MVDQNTTKLVGFIRDPKIYVHGIPYVTCITYVIYSMLLGRPWFKDAKVTHYQGNNTMTIQGNGMVKRIEVTKHLGAEVKRPKVLLCCDCQNGIIDIEEDITFAIE
jgi:hypothetical protein